MTFTSEPDWRNCGVYVYLWFSDCQVIYVGKGQGKRAIEKHGDLAERFRFDAGENFGYEIVQSRMVEEIAIELERALIKYYRPIGNGTHNNDNGTFRYYPADAKLQQALARAKEVAEQAMEDIAKYEERLQLRQHPMTMKATNEFKTDFVKVPDPSPKKFSDQDRTDYNQRQPRVFSSLQP